MTAETSPASPTITSDDRPRARQGVAAVELAGEVVLLDDTGQVHLLNPTAGLLWGCFDGRGSVGEIAADAAEAFGVPIGVVEPEVVALAVDLATRGLVDLGADTEDDSRPARPSGESDAVVVQPGSY